MVCHLLMLVSFSSVPICQALEVITSKVISNHIKSILASLFSYQTECIPVMCDVIRYCNNWHKQIRPIVFYVLDG